MPRTQRDAAVLVDTGPIVAIFDEGDADHERCLEVFRSIRCPLITVWPVLTETMHLLSTSPRSLDRCWEVIHRGAMRISQLSKDDAPRMRQLMAKYADLPMDLADAALVHVAEREGLRTIFTLDYRDFRVYRPSHVRSLRLLPP